MELRDLSIEETQLVTINNALVCYDDGVEGIHHQVVEGDDPQDHVVKTVEEKEENEVFRASNDRVENEEDKNRDKSEGGSHAHREEGDKGVSAKKINHTLSLLLSFEGAGGFVED